MDELWYMALGPSVFLSVLFSISLPTSILEASCNKLYHLCQMIILGTSRVADGKKKNP